MNTIEELQEYSDQELRDMLEVRRLDREVKQMEEKIIVSKKAIENLKKKMIGGDK